jgi:hypothetical protein
VIEKFFSAKRALYVTLLSAHCKFAAKNFAFTEQINRGSDLPGLEAPGQLSPMPWMAATLLRASGVCLRCRMPRHRNCVPFSSASRIAAFAGCPWRLEWDQMSQ